MIEPLERGFGITLGNALRRVLLCVDPRRRRHLREDRRRAARVLDDSRAWSKTPIDLLLNLKGLPVKLNTDDPKVLTLNVSGATEVTAGDIAPDADVEILQPDYHIATLTKKDAKLPMEIGVEKSRGYVTADRQRNIEHMIGLIPMDSIFSPIRKVNFTVDDTRVGQSVDFDRLTHRDRDQRLDHARRRALRGGQHLHRPARSCFIDFSTEEKPVPTAPASEWDVPVETLNLSVRSFNCLKRAGISKVSELLDMTEDEIFKMRNFGKKSLDEIKQVLERRGLSLRPAERYVKRYMPHQIANKRLSRTDGHRRALLATSRPRSSCTRRSRRRRPRPRKSPRSPSG